MEGAEAEVEGTLHLTTNTMIILTDKYSRIVTDHTEAMVMTIPEEEASEEEEEDSVVHIVHILTVALNTLDPKEEATVSAINLTDLKRR